MATRQGVLVLFLAIAAVAAEQLSYTPRLRRRPMLSAQEGPDSGGSESELEPTIIQGPPSDFSPSKQIPESPRPEGEASEIGGLTVQDPPKGWPFSDMALQEKFQDQMMQDETGQRQTWSNPPEEDKSPRQMQVETGQMQVWSNPPEENSKPPRQVYRQGRVLDGSGRQGRKEQGSREQDQSGEQPTYRDYPKKKRIVKPSHSHGTRIRQSQSGKQYKNSESSRQEEQPQQYHQEQFEQPKHVQQEQFPNPEQVQQHEEPPPAPRHQREGKRTTKRRPSSAANAGSPSSVNVGYSINFGSQEPGGATKTNENPLGLVQNEVVHGEGAVSYSNAQLGSPHPGQLRRPNNANSIDGRPIYVAPITSSGYNRIPHQTSPYHFPITSNQSPEHESLPSPSALIGGQDINNGNYVPEGISVVKSHNHFEPESQIITQYDSGSPVQFDPPTKPTKPPTILHINDGTDFKWKNLGNGVEISAPITPNGLQGGYRESIPIQEDNEDDIPANPFEKKPSLFTPELTKTLISKPIFNHNLGAAQFDDSNVLFPGQNDNLDAGFPSFAKPEALPTPQELTSNHILDEPKIPFQDHQSGPPPSFNRRPNIFNHNFGDSRKPEKGSEDIGDLGFPKFPEMNKIYYLPSVKHGGNPIPAVVMPLSILKQITGALDAQSTSNLGQDISTAEFMKMLGHNDILPENPVSFQEPRPTPAKPRPHGFNPNKGHQNHEGHAPNRGARNHHRFQQSYSPNKYNTGPYGVKITKSVPIYEQHSVAAQNEAQWNSQSPPKHSSQISHYNIPIEAYESLRPNGPSGGNFKGRPNTNHYREGPHDGFVAPSGRQQYRLTRQQNSHQQNRDVAQADHSHGDRDGESFAVSSSYRIGPSSHSGWKQQGRN